MKKLLSLLLGLAIILSTVSFVSAEETGEPNILENFLVMTDQDIANYKKIKRADKKAFEEINYEIVTAKQGTNKEDAKQFVIDSLNDTDYTEEEKARAIEYMEKNSSPEEYRKNDDLFILDFIQKRTEEYLRQQALKDSFPRVELGKDIQSNITLKNEGNITIQLYDINGIVKEETVEGTNAGLNYVPDKAGVYKVKYLVNGFVVGVDTITVEDKNNVSLYTKYPEFNADMQGFGFEIIATSKNYLKKNIIITDIDKYYEFIQELKENPQLAKAKLMETIAMTENFAPLLKTNAKIASLPSTKFGTVEQYQKLVDGITENADSFIAFYNGETKKDKFTGLNAKQAEKMKEESKKNKELAKELQSDMPLENYKTFEEVYGSFEQWVANLSPEAKARLKRNGMYNNESLYDFYQNEKRSFDPKKGEVDYENKWSEYNLTTPVYYANAYYVGDGKTYPVYVMYNGTRDNIKRMMRLSDGSYTSNYVWSFADLPIEIQSRLNDEMKNEKENATPTPEVTPENPPTEKPADPTNTPEDQTEPTPKPEDNKEQPETPVEPTEKPQEQPTAEPQPTEKPADPQPTEKPAEPAETTEGNYIPAEPVDDPTGGVNP